MSDSVKDKTEVTSVPINKNSKKKKKKKSVVLPPLGEEIKGENKGENTALSNTEKIESKKSNVKPDPKKLNKIAEMKRKAEEDSKKLKLLETINDFMSELKETFGSSRRHIRKYFALFKAISPENMDLVYKHCEIFINFCKANRQFILERNEKIPDIEYKKAESMYVDLSNIFKVASDTDKESIWQYLTYILYQVDPTEEIRGALKSKTKTSGFIKRTMDKLLEVGGGEHSDPSTALLSLMSGGILSEIMSDANQEINNGGNVKDLLKDLNNVISGLSDDPETESIKKLTSNLMSKI